MVGSSLQFVHSSVQLGTIINSCSGRVHVVAPTPSTLQKWLLILPWTTLEDEHILK
jgi:hypothetical protein